MSFKPDCTLVCEYHIDEVLPVVEALLGEGKADDLVCFSDHLTIMGAASCPSEFTPCSFDGGCRQAYTHLSVKKFLEPEILN